MTARRQDLLLALALAAVLSLGWTLGAWGDLSRLRLPDTDDMMRLQQVRDWLGGQAFADVAQHRLGLGGPIHWSRLVDLPIAAQVRLFAPLGRHDAEVAAVIVWPALLFAAALFLTAQIARRLETPVATATIVAAVAYPSTTVFMPGRIDHHGVQLVLLLAAILAALGPATARRGTAAGLCVAASLVVGLETAPLLGVLGAAVVVEWVVGGSGRRLIGLGAGTLAGLVLGRLYFASAGFADAACDGFTGEAWRAAMVMAGSSLLVSVTPGLRAGMTKRAVAAILLFGTAGLVAVACSPDCLHPYGRVDPLLARRWLTQVAEAQTAWNAPGGAAIGYLGVMVAGIAATAWRLHSAASRGWALLMVIQLAAMAVAAVQLRGAQSGAILSAPALAAVIDAARRRGALALAGAWLGSAGLLYPIAASALVRAAPERAAPMPGDCTSAATMAALARLPKGTVIAPIDAGAWIVATTPHRVLAAPLHRNAAGNRAIYRFYLGRPDGAAALLLRQWKVDYILACAAMPGADRPGTAAAALIQGKLLGAQPVARSADGSVIYLSDPARRL